MTEKTTIKTAARGILKRGERFILRTHIDGKQIWRTLDATNLRDAKAEAKRLRTVLHLGDREAIKATSRRSDWPTLAELATVYLEEGKKRMLRGERISLPTCRRNLQQLAQLAGGSLDVSVAVLTESNLRKFADNWLSGYEVDPVRLDKRRSSILSMHTGGKSVFAEWALKAYRASGFELPLNALKAWKKTKAAVRPSGKYRVPIDHPELVARTLAAGAELDGPLGLAWVLLFELGLRASEAAAAKMHWITPDGDHYRIDIVNRPGEFKTKGVERYVAIHADTFARLNDLRPTGSAIDGHILPGHKTGRSDLLSRDLSKWMRGLGWSADLFTKCGHELRKLQGSRWFSAPNLGPAVAQEWLGHADISTTCKFYAALTRRPAPLPPVAPDGPASLDAWADDAAPEKHEALADCLAMLVNGEDGCDDTHERVVDAARTALGRP